MCCDLALAVDYMQVLSASSEYFMKFCLHENFIEIVTETFIENFM